MNISSLNNENLDNKPIQTQSQKNDNSVGSIFLSFNDDNGIVEKSDIIFANEETKKIATPLFTFLDKYCDGNQKWTTALSDTVKMFINHFNESLANYDKDSNVENSEQGVIVTDKNGKIKFSAFLNNDNKLRQIQSHPIDGISTSVSFDYNNNILSGYQSETTKFDRINESEDILDHTSANFREDGTIINKHGKDNTNGLNIIKEFNYDNNEKLIYKTSKYPIVNGSPNEILVEEKFKDNYCYQNMYEIKHYNGCNEEKEIRSKVVYDSEYNELIRTDYENKKVVNFVDNRKNKPDFDKTKLNGKFDNPIKQGASGVCYIVGIVNSMILSKNNNNLEDLNDCVSYDKEKGIGTVTFKGLNKTYSFPASEIEKHMTRLGTEDPDFPLLALGYEQFLLEDDGDNIDHDIEAQAKNAKTIDGGSPSDFYFAITGKEMIQEKLTKESFNKAKDSLNNGGVVNACTVSSDINDEIANNHNYSVLNIDDKNVTLYEPNEGKKIICSIEKFKQRFAGIFYN